MFRNIHTLLYFCIAIILVGVTFAYIPVLAESTAGSANIVVDESAQISLSQELLRRVADTWPWYLTRASGLVAGLALIFLMLSGIGFITGRTYAFLEPLTGWATHRALGIILALSISLHMFALYFDSFVPFNLQELFVPFASSYKPIEIFGASVGSLYVALGVISFYLIILIVLVSVIWVEGKNRAWKAVHLLSYLATAFVFIHGLYLGTDLSGGFLRFAWIALGLIILIASVFRLWRAKTV